MRVLVGVLALAASLGAQDWSIERLFSRPYLWGTAPERLRWSKEGHTLVFLWNAGGRRFLDLYAYHPDSRKLARLTDLEGATDELNRSEEEKDERLKRNLAPPAGLGSFHLSRDGSRAAFAWRGDLYVVATGGGQPPFRITRTKDSEGGPQLSPDGSKLAYTRGGQLYVQDLGGGQTWQVTDLETPGATLAGYRWSPDGRRFVYTVRRGAGRSLLLPNYSGRFVTARPFRRNVAGDEPQETADFVVPSEGGKPSALEAGPWGGKVHAWGADWSPDSTRLARCIIHPSMKKQQILVSDAKTGKTDVVWEENDEKWVEPTVARWSPDSRWILFLSDRDGFSHLYRVAAGGGQPEQITRGPWEIHGETFSEDPQWVGDYIYYASTEVSTAERHFYRIRPDGSGKEKLSTRQGLNIGLVSEDGLHTAWMLADLNAPLDLWVDDARLTESPRPEFRKYAWPATRFVSFPSRGDGKTVAAKMLLPPGYQPEERGQKPRPAVLFIHGSGYATSVLKQWGSYNELRYAFNCYLAHKGYVVLDMDYRGSSGYGRAWRTDVYLHLGGRDLEDVLGGVEYLRGLGNIDMSRLGIWGVSYGGFMTDMAMFLSPDTFRAGASWAAVNDWENYNAFYTAQRLTTPQLDPEAYRRSSPIHFSNLLKNRLLVVHGMVDNNVLFQDAVQLIEKLIQEGKDFAQASYPEESHAFVRDESFIDAFRRTAEWLDRHLQ